MAVGLLTLAGHGCSADGETLGGGGNGTGVGAGAGHGGDGIGGLNLGGQDGIGGGLVNPCEGHDGESFCDGHKYIQCSDGGAVLSEENCQTGGTCSPSTCVDGQGCVLCQAGQYWCDGPQVKLCNTTVDPVDWEIVQTCGSGQACDVTQGTCVPMPVVGDITPTASYFQYAQFVYDEANPSGAVYRGGMDVGSYDNYIYVHRETNGGLYGALNAPPFGVDVYSIELLDSDGDGELEPNQHPDNPDHTGPIEERVLTYLSTYEVAVGGMHCSELFVLADRFYSIPCSGTVNEYIFSSGVTTAVVSPAQAIAASFLGYDDVNGVWYVGHEGRQVHAFHEATNQWVPQFQWPDLAGSHGDGAEVVSDPKTDIPYVYISDMTSDFLAQYRCYPDQGWVMENLFDYVGNADDFVEGMGFGALNHFWVSTIEMPSGFGGVYVNVLKEIGGNDLAEYTDPPPDIPK